MVKMFQIIKDHLCLIFLLSKLLKGDDEDDDLKTSLCKFDENNSGKINSESFFKSLCTYGEKLTKEELNSMMDFIYVDKNEKIDIEHLLQTLNGSLDE